MIVVPDTIDPTGTRDATDQLDAFFARLPDEATVRFPERARYRLDRPLVIRPPRGLTVYGGGAVLRQGVERAATAPAPVVELRGGRRHRWHNLTAEGLRPSTATTFDVTREGQHGWRIVGGFDVQLRGCNARNTYGDGIYLGAHRDIPAELVWLDACTTQNTGRHAIALVAARRVVTELSTIDRPTRASFCIEPNGLAPVDDVHVIDNTFETGGRLLWIPMRGGPNVNRIRIARNRLRGEQLQIDGDPGATSGARRAGFEIVDNVSTGDAVGGGRAIRLARSDQIRISGNVQACKPTAVGVELEACSRFWVSGNRFDGAAYELRTIDTVAGGYVPFDLPEPQIPGRGAA